MKTGWIPAGTRSLRSGALISALLVHVSACSQPDDPPPAADQTPVEPVPRASASSAANRSPFTLFESGQVRPLALSPSGRLLLAVNTPDNRLEVFHVGASGLSHRASVPVGLEPVAVAAPSDDEAWVVNHLSDSVS